MTQLAGRSGSPFLPSSNLHRNNEPPAYFIREPASKRPAPPPEPEEMLDGAPRAKRRFEKVSAGLEHFSISRDTPASISMDSSSDEDMVDLDDNPSTSQTDFIIEEPQEEPKRIRLDEKLVRYLEMAKQNRQMLPKLSNCVRGDELTLWRPPVLTNPLNDPTMRGRITEIEDDEELADEVDDISVAFPDDGSSDEMSSPSSLNSAPNIVELSDSPSTSPPSMQTDDNDMDFD